MILLYKNISDLIPFNVDSLIDCSKFEIISEPPCENFVHKQNLAPNVLNPDFLSYLKSKKIDVQKVSVWHWYCKDPHWAHIDCNAEGEISAAAINWTIQDHLSQVNFYDIPIADKTVKFENNVDTGWRTDNVSSYIPINVKGILPDAVWNNRGPALINTSVPHLVVAPEMRRSITIGVMPPVPSIEVLLERLQS